jgi:SET domain-containing protein
MTARDRARPHRLRPCRASAASCHRRCTDAEPACSPVRRRFLSRWDVAVLDTEDKGKGLFAQHAIPEGAYLFDYEGEPLDLPAYQSRYPDKVSDYAVGIKMPSGVINFMDAADPRKSGLARFMNHDRRRANVRRATTLGGHPAPPAPPAPLAPPCAASTALPPPQVKRSTKFDDPTGPRVLMYASKRIEAGEELQWDYGAGYWAAREGLVEK